MRDLRDLRDCSDARLPDDTVIAVLTGESGRERSRAKDAASYGAEGLLLGGTSINMSPLRAGAKVGQLAARRVHAY